MIDEKTAIQIATDFIKAEGVDVEGFSSARLLLPQNIWACCFSRIVPKGVAESPGVLIVHVNGSTGESEFFDVL